MARPIKVGLEYFPLDTEWDIKMKLLQAKHKLFGVGCVVRLLQCIYKEGYFYRWDEETITLFCAENYTTPEEVEPVVMYAASKGIFDLGMMQKHQVLTSHGIQKRWSRACSESKRKEFEIEKKYNLLFPPEETPIIPEETQVNSEETPIIPEESAQSIVKESKRKERKSVCEFTPAKTLYGTSSLVALTDAEHDELITRYGDIQTHKIIETLDAYKASKGKPYKSDAGAIRSWVLDKVKPTPIFKPPTCPRCGAEMVDGMCGSRECPSWHEEEEAQA